MNLTAPLPEFGLDPLAAEYILRPGGYVVVFNAASEVAVVGAPTGLFLPGGGQDVGETPEAAVIREVREECGWEIRLGNCIGAADELVFAATEQQHYRKRCLFFLAEILAETTAVEPDHELHWFSPAAAQTSLRPASQRWAVAEACRLTGR
jgi:8-oxo-dGTP diphosphatase